MGIRSLGPNRFALTIALGLAAGAVSAAPARAVELHIDTCRARGDSVEIVARLEVRAVPAEVWRVLTDYDAMVTFVPGLATSKRIARTNEGPVVQQVSVARVLFLKSRVLTLLQMREIAPDTLRFRSLAGDFKRLRGSWVLEPMSGGRTRVTCRCGATPRRWIPGTLLAWAARGEFGPRALAFGREAERRSRHRS